MELWTLLTIAGPILLGLGLLWAVLHNRVSRRTSELTEEATRQRYEEQSRADAERESQ